MKLLVGVPSFRRPAMLAALLDSLARQEPVPGVTVEIFVADNDPERCEAAKLCRTRAAGYPLPLTAEIVAQPGISAARNRILDAARSRGADLIAMIDDDEAASPTWLAELVAARARYGAQVVGGAVDFHFERQPTRAVMASGAFAAKRGISGPIAMLNSSCNVLLDAAALARIGWPRFDIAFGLSGGEDKEWFTRLRRAGLTFAWAEEALVHETIPAARIRTGAVIGRAFGVGSSDYRIAARHEPPVARRAHLAKSAVALTAGAVLVPALIVPRYRLWLLRRVARAAGRLSAAVGRSHAQYGALSP